MRTDELDFDLPPELVATHPPPTRDGGRLLVLDRETGARTHGAVSELAWRVPERALLVVNDTRVIPARLRGAKASGGRVELMLLRPVDAGALRWSAFGRATKPLRPGTVVHIAEGFSATIESREPDGPTLTVSLSCEGAITDPWAAIEAHGEVPLPPYMHRRPTDEDRERYQTVYARERGSVAAPTAGLHLTNELFAALEARGVTRASVTLHVGAGTFAPVTADTLEGHAMHSEHYEVPAETARAIREAKREGRRVLAVGTTVVRTLESWALREETEPGEGALSGDTRLLLQPGSRFRVIDALLTNFHLPRSTLLALVMAFAGEAPVRAAYEEAVRLRYRFYSYGDAMLVV